MGEPGLLPGSLEQVCLTSILNGHFVVLWDKPSPRHRRSDFRESATQDQAKQGTAPSSKKREVKSIGHFGPKMKQRTETLAVCKIQKLLVNAKEGPVLCAQY